MTQEQPSRLRRVVRQPEVLRATGWGKSTLADKIAKGEFHKPFKLDDGGRALGWWEDDIVEHQARRDASRNEDAA